MRLIRRFVYLVLYGDFQYSELQAGLVELLWGMWILIPRDSEYRIGVMFLRQLANPWIVSTIMFATGLFQLWALLGQHYRWRKLAAFCSIGVWGFMSILLGQIAPTGLAFPSAVVFSLGALWGLWGLVRLGSDHGNST